MAQSRSQPILLLAFANEQGQAGQYLRNLPEELRELQRVLRPGEREGRYRLVPLSNASLESLIETFQDPAYQGQLALFHYGGHARGDELLLEGPGRQTAAIDAKGLLPFLAGLRLVFLNGCATLPQVEGLLAAGVGTVVATAQTIPDETATAFAAHFYRGLAGGATLREAFNQAEGAIQAAGGGQSLRGLHWGGESQSWPWRLSEGQPGTADWRLPAFAPLQVDPQARLEQMPLDDVPKSAPLPPGSRLPFNPNPLFVGREAELRSLARTLKGRSPAAIGQVGTATGLGGIGKSQLAVEFAYRYGQYFAGGVFWLSFADPDSIPAQVAACGDSGGMALTEGFSSLPLDDQVRLVYAAWQSPLPRLLIFDNCEAEALLAQWRPAAGGCRLLLTSRRSSWSQELGVQALPLRVLSLPESVALLQNYRPDLATAVAETIAQELGRLPLALRLAGSFLKRYQHAITPESYLKQLQSRPLLSHPSLQGRGESHSATGHDLDVGRTFALSYDQLDPAERTDQVALALLGRAACFAPGEPIPRHLLLATLTLPEEEPEAALQAEDGLGRLLELGLLEAEDGGTLLLHRLLALFVQQLSSGDEAQAAVEEILLAEAGRLNQTGYPAPLLAWQSHLRVVTEAAQAREDKRSVGLCNTLGYHLWMIGTYAEARPYFERALAIYEQVLGPMHPNTATSLNNLGLLLQAQGVYSEARPYLERALAITEQVLGLAHPDTATSLNNLGLLLQAQGAYAEAKSYLERALTITEQVLGLAYPDTATSLNNLGLLLQDQGAYAEARSYLERALAIWEKILGPMHPNTATSLNNLGALLQAQGAYVEARPYFERALAICEQVLGPMHPNTATSLNNLGLLLQAQGAYAEAKSYYERALTIREQILGPVHPDTAQSLNNLGFLLQAQGSYAKARPYFERALIIKEKVLGSAHPDTAQSLNNLGASLQAQGSYTEARTYFERALIIREQALGSAHPDTAQSLNNLGFLLRAQGVYAEARPYFERALAIYEQVLGPEHPDTALSLNNLGGLLQAQGTYAEARLYYERALAIFEARLGPAHPYIRTIRGNLAALDEAAGIPQNDE